MAQPMAFIMATSFVDMMHWNADGGWSWTHRAAPGPATGRGALHSVADERVRLERLGIIDAAGNLGSRELHPDMRVLP